MDDEERPEPLMAGAIAGLIAETIMHPFDTISHRAKVNPFSTYGGFFGAMSPIVREEGFRGLYAGVTATMLMGAPSTAVYFGTYELAKRMGFALVGEDYAPAVYFVAGGLAEAMSSVALVPMEVAKCRMQLGENPHRATGGIVAQTTNERGLFNSINAVVLEEGVSGLWAGWRACLLHDCVFSAMQFVFYEEIKWNFQKYTDRNMAPEEALWAGAAAGGVSAILSNPLDVITSRQMVQGPGSGFGSGILDVFRTARAEGAMGLWRGSFPRAIYAMPLSALQFGLYEAACAYFVCGDIEYMAPVSPDDTESW